MGHYFLIVYEQEKNCQILLAHNQYLFLLLLNEK